MGTLAESEGRKSFCVFAFFMSRSQARKIPDV